MNYISWNQELTDLNIKNLLNIFKSHAQELCEITIDKLTGNSNIYLKKENNQSLVYTNVDYKKMSIEIQIFFAKHWLENYAELEKWDLSPYGGKVLSI